VGLIQLSHVSDKIRYISYFIILKSELSLVKRIEGIINTLIIVDGNGAVRKFCELKKEWGFEQLISSEELFDSSNGYFVDDSCVFGAEVFVIRRCDKLESLYMVNDPPQVSLTCKLERFSNLTKYTSKSFTVGERDW
jgi:hypothetical protein